MSIVQDGLHLWYDGIDNAGESTHDSSAAVWKDLSGNNRDGVIAGETAWGLQCLAFYGTNGWVNCGAFNPTAQATIDVVVEFKTSVATEGNAVASNWESGGLGIYQYQARHSFGFYVGGKWRSANGSTCNVRRIVHLTATYDGTNGKLYEDGVLVATTPISGTINTTTNNTVYSIGSNPSGSSVGSMPLTGYVYAVRLYDRALTADEVLANYQHDAGRFTTHSSFEPAQWYAVKGETLMSIAESIRRNQQSFDTYTPEQMAHILNQVL